MKSKTRWVVVALLVVVGLGLGGAAISNVFGRTKRTAPIQPRDATGPGLDRTPTYSAGSFTFGSTKQLLPGSPVLGFQDVEPEIKVDLFGNIYITAIEGLPAGVDLWKSTDLGGSFQYLGQPDGAQCPLGSTCTNDAGVGGGDDSIDVSPGGYLYVSSLWLGSVTMSASYDGGTGGVDAGQKWEVNPAAALVPSDDRQWVAAYGPQTVYMSYRQILAAGANLSNVIFVAKSTDGGKTFPQQVATFPATSLVTARREGNLVVDPYNGNLYTSFRPQELNGHTRAELWLLKSTDGGSTWAMSQIYQGPVGSDVGNIFPVMAVDRGGNVHLAFSQCDYNAITGNSSNCGVYLMSSGDAGATWLSPVQVNNGAETSYAILPWMVAGSPGTVDLTWYGSNIADSTQIADWHMYFAQVTSALTNTPAISQNQAIPQVVHNKDICLKGGACGTGNRKLAEYYQVALDPAGNAHIAFTDTVNNSDAAGNGRIWYTKQSGGPSAYSPPAAPAASTFSANVDVGTPGGEPGIKVDSFSCIFIHAPGGASLWKSVNKGVSFLPKINPVAAFPLSGGDEEIVPIRQLSGARPDTLYFADLATLTSINIAESTNGGTVWFKPGPGGAAGNVDASTDRQWLSYDRVPSANDLTVYEMDHEAATEEIRFNALTNDGVWSPPSSGMTEPELNLPPSATFPNTNPGPVLVDRATHIVYGFFGASVVHTNRANPPFGKMPHLWEAMGPAPMAAGLSPGPFINKPVFKGVIESPQSPQPTPPPGAATFGTNIANDFPSAAIDRNGNIYAVWAMNNSRTNEYMVWFAASHDHGQNFYGPFQVSQGPGAAVMPWIDAGDDGRVAIVYYATTTPGDPNFAVATTPWNAMFAQSLNANSREPVFTISQVSDHVMHNGGICNLGLLCTVNNGDRSLADFFQVAIAPDGFAYIAFADNGGIPRPATHVSFARQLSGPLGLTNPTLPSCLDSTTLQLADVVSRKTHGGQGDFDIHLPLTGPAGIECRKGQPNDGSHTLIFTFANVLQSVGTADSTQGSAGGSPGPDPRQWKVDLSNVPNNQTITVTLHNVNDGAQTGDVSVQVRFILGDVNFTGLVDGNDVSGVQGHTRQFANGGNFFFDVDTTGLIDGNDVSTTQGQTRSGTFEKGKGPNK